MPKLSLHGGNVSGFIDNVTPHGVPGVMRGVAFYPGNLTNLIPDGLSLRNFVGTPVLGCFNMLRNQVCEANLTVILWFRPNYFAGIRNAPECMGIVADTVEYLERHPVFIADIFCFNAFEE